MRWLFATTVLIATQMAGPAFAQSLSSEIAPTGKLRSAAIAVPVVRAVAEPVGKFIAERLGLPFDSVVYPNPPAYAQSFGKGEWDIAIGSRVFATPDKADLLTSDVWLVDLIYVAAPGSAAV